MKNSRSIKKLGDYIKEVSTRNKQELDIPVLSVTNNRGFILSEEQFSKQVYSSSVTNYKIVSKNQIAYNPSRINVGSIAVLEDYEQGLISPLYTIFETTNGLNPRYLLYYLKSNEGLYYIKSKATGSVRDIVKIDALKQLNIYVPDIDEQRKIVEILDKVNKLIDKRKKQIEICNELIKSQFIEMFEDLKDEVALSQYIDSLTAGKSLAGEAECENKVLKTGSVSYDYFDENEVKNLPMDYEPLESHLVREGNVIISRMNTAELVGATGYVWRTPENTYLPDRLWRAEIKDNVNPIFLWQLLIQESTKGKIRRIASGTSGSMKNISKQGLLGIKVINVDIEKQNQFAQFVQQVDKLKFKMEQSLVELENNFNSLMQRAFKGELF